MTIMTVVEAQGSSYIEIRKGDDLMAMIRISDISVVGATMLTLTSGHKIAITPFRGQDVVDLMSGRKTKAETGAAQGSFRPRPV